MIEIGRKIRSNEVVAVSENGKLFATFSRFDLGNKGRIYGKTECKDMPTKLYMSLIESGFAPINVDGTWYILLEYVRDYPQIFSRMNWWENNPASAYSK